MDTLLIVAAFVIGTILYIGTIFFRRYLQKYRVSKEIFKGLSLDIDAYDGGKKAITKKAPFYISGLGGSGVRLSEQFKDKLSGWDEGFYGFCHQPEHQRLGLSVGELKDFFFVVGLGGGTGTSIIDPLSRRCFNILWGLQELSIKPSAEGANALELSTIELQHEIARYYLKTKFGDKLSNKDIEDIIFTLIVSSGHLYCQNPTFPSFAPNLSKKEDPISSADNAKKTYTSAKMNIKIPFISLMTNVKTKNCLIEVGIFIICLAIAFLVLSIAFHIWQSPFPP